MYTLSFPTIFQTTTVVTKVKACCCKNKSWTKASIGKKKISPPDATWKIRIIFRNISRSNRIENSWAEVSYLVFSVRLEEEIENCSTRCYRRNFNSNMSSSCGETSVWSSFLSLIAMTSFRYRLFYFVNILHHKKILKIKYEVQNKSTLLTFDLVK